LLVSLSSPKNEAAGLSALSVYFCGIACLHVSEVTVKCAYKVHCRRVERLTVSLRRISWKERRGEERRGEERREEKRKEQKRREEIGAEYDEEVDRKCEMEIVED
jgi:hypothetical protein